jgi:hypothetical protein
MRYNAYGDKQSPNARRQEQVRHLLRSVGVELDGGSRVPYFVENAPGKFRRNPTLKNVEITDGQLRTLEVPAEVPAKIPADGLPVNVLKYLIEIGATRADDL